MGKKLTNLLFLAVTGASFLLLSGCAIDVSCYNEGPNCISNSELEASVREHDARMRMQRAENCDAAAYPDNHNHTKNEATTTVIMYQGDGNFFYKSTGEHGFAMGVDNRHNCRNPSDVNLRIPPGTYTLTAFGKNGGNEWKLPPVEFQPHATYRLTEIALNPLIPIPGAGITDGMLPKFPQILQQYTLPSDQAVFEIVRYGLYNWHVGLTETQVREAMKIAHAKTLTDNQFRAQLDRWLAENERIIAGSEKVAAARVSAYQYQGRYALTRGDSCAEDTPLFSELFMEISASLKNSETYYVSFGGFLYDDKNSAAWPEKPGPEGALLSVIEDPIPAMDETNFRPMIFQHRMTLKPLSANHLMISDWTRTEYDRESKGALKTVDMLVYTNNSDQNAYIDHVGSNGYCLKRIGGLSG